MLERLAEVGLGLAVGLERRIPVTRTSSRQTGNKPFGDSPRSSARYASRSRMPPFAACRSNVAVNSQPARRPLWVMTASE